MESHQTPRKKTSMSWLDLSVWLNEQRDVIKHSYIDNLYLIRENSFLLILKLYNSMKSISLWFIIEPSRRVSITFTDLKLEYLDEKYQRVWRSLLKECMVVDLYQIPCERILVIELNCRYKTRKLIVELLPRGVLCVLDDQDRIILCNEYKTMRDRAIKPNIKYQAPPIVNICTNNLINIWHNAQSNDIDIARLLIKEIGLPPEIAEAIIIQCGLRNKKISELSNTDITCINIYYNNLVIDINKELKPCIVFDAQNTPLGFYPTILPQFNELKIEYQTSFNDAINKFYENELASLLLITTTSHEMKRDIDNLRKTISRIDNMIIEMSKELDILKSKLLIMENNYIELETLHNYIVEKVRADGWNNISSICGNIHKTKPEKGIYEVKINDIVLELNVRKPFIENYNDLRRAVAGLEKSITRARDEKNQLIKKLEELYKEIEYKKLKIRHKLSTIKEWYESYIWYVTSSGFLVIGGRDASQNTKIVKRFIEHSDIVLHADIHGASTIVIKSRNKTIDYDSINEAAIIAASYSKAWKLKLMSVDVFWVYGHQVSLSPPSGQYLSKGSYMVYGEKNFIRNVELKLAIGVGDFNGRIKIIIGPENVIDKKSLAYIVITPGDLEPKTIAQVFIEFLKSKKLDQIATLLDVNDIVKNIPGRSNIIKKVARPPTTNGEINAEGI